MAEAAGPIRVNAYLAKCGVASRRGADRLIAEGLVGVNGAPAQVGTKIDPDRDSVTLRGKNVQLQKRIITIVLNKPPGYIVSASDPHHSKDKTVFALINEVEERLFSIGRLDRLTSGLLLMTNDGDLAHALTHPSHEIEKVYRADITGWPEEETLAKLRSGVMLDGRITARADVRCIRKTSSGSRLEIAIHEGRNRQVRRMCESLGHRVERLWRVSVAGIRLRGLKSGEWRLLYYDEKSQLYAAASLGTHKVNSSVAA